MSPCYLHLEVEIFICECIYRMYFNLTIEHRIYNQSFCTNLLWFQESFGHHSNDLFHFFFQLFEKLVNLGKHVKWEHHSNQLHLHFLMVRLQSRFQKKSRRQIHQASQKMAGSVGTKMQRVSISIFHSYFSRKKSES